MAEPAQPESHTFLGSTSVDSASFDKGTGDLEVLFVNGRQYTYSEVTESEWRAFVSSPSAGRFVHQNLKGRES